MDDGETGAPPNGSAAAAVLSASIGCAVLGACALAGDASAAMGRALNWYRPTGPLSGVTDIAIITWLATWAILAKRWTRREVSMRRVNWICAALLLVAVLLTFPPFMDLLQGK
jgi:peptidoglycan biosynthesis protein MviN/MurJ (putative lipid II flippase)